eukprot:gene24208-30527_t
MTGQTLYVVHRLDMETSGTIIFGKTLAAAQVLGRQFREREIHKVYIAKLI